MTVDGVVQPAAAPRFSADPGGGERAACHRGPGQHRRSCSTGGFTRTEVDALLDAGVVGQAAASVAVEE